MIIGHGYQACNVKTQKTTPKDRKMQLKSRIWRKIAFTAPFSPVEDGAKCAVRSNRNGAKRAAAKISGRRCKTRRSKNQRKTVQNAPQQKSRAKSEAKSKAKSEPQRVTQKSKAKSNAEE